MLNIYLFLLVYVALCNLFRYQLWLLSSLIKEPVIGIEGTNRQDEVKVGLTQAETVSLELGLIKGLTKIS